MSIHTISTFTGKSIDPFNLQPDDICAEDIAHALANVCRFGGHSSSHYSVGHHCLLVSEICSRANKLWGLLHDASEAYLSDIIQPLKRTGTFDLYRLLESRFSSVILAKYGLSLPEPDEVKVADQTVLATEFRDLMPAIYATGHVDRLGLPAPLKMTIRPYDPRVTEQLYLQKLEELTR